LAVAVVADVAAVVAAAADGGVRSAIMKPANQNTLASSFVVLVILFTGMVMAAGGPRSFATPEDGVKAFVDAVRADDKPALSSILGPDAQDIIASGDETQDKNTVKAFLAAYDSHSDIAHKGSSVAVLNVGKDEWPLPIPLIKTAAGWHFDTVAGKREILARRIGRNEMAAIQATLAYVDAQRDYASQDRGDGVLDYAQRFISTPGKHDGLYWQTADSAPLSPLGPTFAAARNEGYGFGGQSQNSGPQPYHGYYYRILTAQGPAAKGGAYSYLAGNHMIGGFALVAYPASYRVSGVTSFIVNQDGVVFQRDLGPSTADIAGKMNEFNPGPGWTKA
jgi:hypothetical protein